MPLTDECPENLHLGLERVAAVAIDTFAAHALPLNLQRGKSEASVKLRGSRAQVLWKSPRRSAENISYSIVHTRSKGSVRLFITYIYTHMGRYGLILEQMNRIRLAIGINFDQIMGYAKHTNV